MLKRQLSRQSRFLVLAVALSLAGCQRAASVVGAHAASTPAERAQALYNLFDEGNEGSEGTDVLGPNRAISTGPFDENPPAIANNRRAGEYLVVWADFRPANGHGAIVGQRVSATGEPIGGELAISAPTGGAGNPTVTYNAIADEYLVAWPQTDGQAATALMGRRVSAQGDPVGPSFAIDTTPASVTKTVVAYDIKANDYLVIWGGQTTDPATHVVQASVSGRRVGATGTTPEAGFAVGSANAADPALAYNVRDNEYLATWADPVARTLQAQRLDPHGAAIAPGVTLAQAPAFTPAVAYNYHDDQYLVAWSLGGIGLRGQRLDAKAAPLDLAIAITTTPASSPSLAYDFQANSFMAAWTDTRNPLIFPRDPAFPNPDVFAQVVGPAGELVGDNLPIAATNSRESHPAVASNCTTKSFFVAYLFDPSSGPFASAPNNVFGRRVGQ